MRKTVHGYIMIGRTITMVIALLLCIHAPAQERGIDKVKKFVTGTFDFVDYVLNDVDTAYVEKNLYNMTFMPEYSFSYEHYRLGTMGNDGQSIGILPENRNKVTLNIGWRWLILGYSIDLQKGRPLKEFNTSLYSARFALDLFYRNGSEGYRISDIKGLYDGDKQLPGNISEEDVLTVKQLGIGLRYAFNKRFSYGAAYGQSTIQRVSAGSLIVGAGYNRQDFTFDHEKVESFTGMKLKEELKYRRALYNDFSISLGYAYNWAFAKNFLGGISFEPSVGYKQTKLNYSGEEKVQGSVNMDFTTRAALVYNNQRYYAGASLESHTFYYRKKPLNISNGFGLLEVYVGFNFWRRK